MRLISKEAIAGLAIAVVLSIGATGGNGQQSASRLSPLANGPAAWMASTFQICGDVVLNRALDAYGMLIAHIRQI